jgi:ribosomal protein S18 acetylase RimI-like enzyme
MRRLLAFALAGKLWYQVTVDAVFGEEDGEHALSAAVVFEWMPTAQRELAILYMAPGAEATLEELFRGTRACEWRVEREDEVMLVFPACDPKTFAVAMRVCAERGLERFRHTECFEWRGDVPSSTTRGTRQDHDGHDDVDDAYVIRPLDVRHTELVNSTWPHRHTASEVRVRAQIERLATMAAYRVIDRSGCDVDGKTDPVVADAPSAWALTQPSGEISMLYTDPAHRRKKLAERVVRALHRAQGQRANAYIIKTNDPSTRLFRDVLGWECAGDAWWFVVRRPPRDAASGVSGSG